MMKYVQALKRVVWSVISMIKSEQSSYAEQVKHQIKQFQNPEKLKKLPDVYHYYMRKFIAPQVQQVFGVSNSLQLYVREFTKGLANTNSNRIVSIGSGDANLEINIALKLSEAGINNFVIDCLELSPIRIERAIENAKQKGIANKLNFIVTDLNSWQPDCKYAGVMAHHVLHHITNLEGLFSAILTTMEPQSAFVSIDMIGRNGHMRWPECESYINEIWKTLPRKYKFNHQFQKTHEDFINWNCAHKGFEGIRAEDILPLLMKNFQFEKFLGYGNLIDIFVERGYGHNFDAENDNDLKFIDSLALMNDFLLMNAYLKPTIMFSVWKSSEATNLTTSCYPYQSPLSSIRETEFSKNLS